MTSLQTQVVDSFPYTESTSVKGAVADVAESSEVKKLDLSAAIQEKFLSIHKHADMQLGSGEVVGQIRVFDLDHVYADKKANTAISNAYITPLFVIEAFARHYQKSLFREVTRGNDKGRFILDPAASSYVHKLSDGGELMVNAETIKVGDKSTRRLTIEWRNQGAKEGAQ